MIFIKNANLLLRLILELFCRLLGISSSQRFRCEMDHWIGRPDRHDGHMGDIYCPEFPTSTPRSAMTVSGVDRFWNRSLRALDKRIFQFGQSVFNPCYR